MTVCGAGTMGRGIAQLAAQSGLSITLFDVDSRVLGDAAGAIRNSLESAVRKNKSSGMDLPAVWDRIRFSSDIGDCRGDLILEAINEDLSCKIDLFRQLAANSSAETVFASNTSSLSLNGLAAAFDHPDRFIGMHFFNPAIQMKLVEVTRSVHTSEAVIQKILDLAARMGKTAVLCRDSPGFIVNRVARPFYLEALRLMEQGLEPELIDRLMEASGFRMGPFRLMDLIGNDVNWAVSRSLYEALGRPARLEPSKLQEAKVKEGRLGKKTGSGFYSYPS